MFDFSSWIDLPLIWSMIIAAAIFFYVWLDGFDLGVGIIFPFAPNNKARNIMMNSIAPFWDGNETWLVMGGGGLFATFPLAYSVLLPAFYIPIITMLFGLILRGVAFEFRFKAEGIYQQVWDYVFHFGSVAAAFCQGLALGAFVQGVKVTDTNYSGGPLDWATGFSVMTGIAVVFGYALLGSTWMVMKTENSLQNWARGVASYALGFVAIFMVLVSICMPFVNESVLNFWFSYPNFFYLLPIPLVTAALLVLCWYDLQFSRAEYRPFFISMVLFLLGYLGLGLSIFPWIVPFQFTIWQAAASGPGLSLLLVGVVPLLPIILGYTGFCYYIFRGKAKVESEY